MCPRDNRWDCMGYHKIVLYLIRVGDKGLDKEWRITFENWIKDKNNPRGPEG